MPPAIPILSSDINKLTKPIDIIKYILRHYMSVPKNINDTFANREISFRYDDAELGSDPESLKNKVAREITKVLGSYFPTATTLDVTVEYAKIDEVFYNISIDVLVIIDSQPHTISQDFKLDSNGNLQFDFQG